MSSVETATGGNPFPSQGILPDVYPERSFSMIRSGLMAFTLALFLMVQTLVFPNPSLGDDRLQLDEERQLLVPKYLLPLLHAPEVHEELKLSAEQISRLEKLFSEIDSAWFQARNLPQEKQSATLVGLEQKTRDWLKDNVSKEQQVRIEQLEYQAQSLRALLRKDLAEKAGLKEQQQQELAKLAQQTDAALTKQKQAVYRGEDTKTIDAEVKQKVQQEQESLKKIFKAEQLQKVSQLLGAPFDTKSLTRIYPMAPEFVGSLPWVNSSPLSMEKLRGKVVLVHFYAFECYNCHANFPIYKRWHEELTKKGVVVIGIQTPETSRERKLEAVKAAAKERGLEFPILFDQDSKNWQAWGNTMWPTVYVVDKNGYLRHWWQGELNWKGATADKTIEQVVDQLLEESTTKR